MERYDVKDECINDTGEFVTYHEAIEYATQQHSIGQHQGVIQAITEFIYRCKLAKADNPSVGYVLNKIIKHYEQELNRLEKINPIGE